MNRPLRSASILGILTTTVLWGSLVSSLQATDWPCFRGPSGQGVSADAGVPVDWSDDINLQWKMELPGKGFSSPIVVGDYVFVTCYSDADGDLESLNRHLLCVHRRRGRVVWKKTMPSTATEVRGPSFGTSHGYASHTPVSDGERVYVLFGNTGVFALDMEGNQVWHRSVGAENAAMFGSAASPILDDNQLIVTAGAESQSILALDKRTGAEVWKTEATSLSRSYCTPVIARNQEGQKELLISVPSEVWSLSPETGKLNWYASTQVDMNAVPNLLVKDGICYVIGGRSGGRAAIRLGGKGDVTESHVLWSMAGGSYVPSPVLHKGHLYWINDRGIATVVNVATGEEVARKRIDGEFYASMLLVGDRLYAVSRFDGTYVLEATPQLAQVAHNRLSDDSDFSASPAVSDGQLILRSDKCLYCVGSD